MRKMFLLFLMGAVSQVYGTPQPFGGSQFGGSHYGGSQYGAPAYMSAVPVQQAAQGDATQVVLPPQYAPAGPAGAEPASFGIAPSVSNPHTPIAPYHTQAVDDAVRNEKKKLYDTLSMDLNGTRTIHKIWADLVSGVELVRQQPRVNVFDIDTTLRNRLASHSVNLTYEQLTDILAHQQKEAHDKLFGSLTGIPETCIQATGEIQYEYKRGSSHDPICKKTSDFQLSDIKYRLKMLPNAFQCYKLGEGGEVTIALQWGACKATNDLSGAIEYAFLNGDIDYDQMFSLEAHNGFGNIAKHRRRLGLERAAPSRMPPLRPLT